MANQVEIYQSDDGALQLSVSLENESVWLTQADMSVLFDKNKRTVSEHIRNIFKDEELIEETVVRNFRTTVSDGKNYTVSHYNLDVIISVGYRVNSTQATRFRQWATKTLKQHLLKGYTLNKERLAQNATELENALQLVKRIAVLPQNSEFGAGLVDIIASYTQTFLWLQQYDEGLLNSPKGELGGALTPLNDAKAAIAQLKQNLINKGEATKLFAQERNNGLNAIWGALGQSVFGEPAYI
ncbi:MAG: virulence RhuM family protein [Pseudoalteromonas nigrifaciens]